MACLFDGDEMKNECQFQHLLNQTLVTEERQIHLDFEGNGTVELEKQKMWRGLQLYDYNYLPYGQLIYSTSSSPTSSETEI